MRHARVVTAVSQPLAEELSGRFGRKVVHIPNGVRPCTPRPPKEIPRWGLHESNYVLCVGRLVPEKRADLLIRAWPRVDTPHKLVIVGDYHETSYGRRLRAANRSPNVLFLGERFGETLAELYSNAAMVVQPSALEGMSMVVLEAAAYGRCILAADIPENRAAMGESMLYFSLDDETELSDRIRRFLKEDAARSAVGGRAREAVHQRYSWPAIAERIERAYCEARWGHCGPS
jgi:glycosyltransferase involved in cell wall biosynthesis